MASPTPGRWHRGPRGQTVYGPDNVLVASCSAAHTGRSLPEAQANARAVEQLPTLHNVLERLIEKVEHAFRPQAGLKLTSWVAY